MKIGCIGLGRMGLPIATNLLDAGHGVYGFDIDPDRTTLFEELGGKTKKSSKAVARESEVVITILRTPEQVRMIGEAVFPKMQQGDFFIDLSTSDPIKTQELAEIASDQKIRVVDAPISGGIGCAEDGTLSIMVGGDKEDVETLWPLFEIIGNQIFHVGTVGSGHAVKLGNQILVGTHVAVAAEVFRLCESMGIQKEILLEVLTASAGTSHVIESKGKRLVDENFEGGVDVDLQHKDLNLALELADMQDVPTYVAATTLQTFIHAKNSGYGQRDHFGVYQLFK